MLVWTYWTAIQPCGLKTRLGDRDSDFDSLAGLGAQAQAQLASAFSPGPMPPAGPGSAVSYWTGEPTRTAMSAKVLNNEKFGGSGPEALSMTSTAPET